MRRRALLRTLGTGLAVGSAGLASGHPTASGDGTPPSETADSQPLGTVPIEDVREMVLGDDGEVAYVATVDGFAVVDVADPADMAVVARQSLFENHAEGPLTGIWDLHCDGDRLLVAGPAFGSPDLYGFGYVDVSDPAAPAVVAEHETPFYTHNCFLADGIGYFTGSGIPGAPLVVVDVESGDELARWSVTEADDRWAELPFGMVNLHDVWVDDGLAYLAYWDAGTWCLDVSDPGEPTLVSRVRGRPLEDLLEIEDTRRESTERPGNDHFVTVDETGDLLGIGTESWASSVDSGQGPGGIEFYDVSDPADPKSLGEIVPPPTPDPTRGGVWTTSHNFDLVGGRCYASWYQGGVTVHDVSDATDPRERYYWRDAGRGKFWTAQLAAPGECFLGASIGAYGTGTEPEESSLVSGLFAFPDPDEGVTAGPSSDAQTTAASAGGREPTPTSGAGPGAGALGGVAGLLGLAGLGGWYRRRSE